MSYMSAKILPPTSELRAMTERGMTHKDIAEEVTRRTGYPITPGAVSVALHRAGATTKSKKYEDEIPWRVKDEHQSHYAARMLRLLGRRRAGTPNSASADAKLDSWLKRLDDLGAVVTYVPDTEEGFFYTSGQPDENGIPILRELSVDLRRLA